MSEDLKPVPVVNETKEKFIFCECGGDLLLVTHYHFHDYDDNYEENEIYLAVFDRQNHPHYGWWERIKYVFKVLRTGEPHNDQVILSKEKSIELVSFIKIEMDI